MRILLALAIALTIRHTIFTNAILPDSATATESSIATYLAVLAAFLLGFYPAAGMDYIMKRGQEFTVKRPHPDAGAMRNSLPLDMIDGLSHYVQFRLEELEYEDVQNLATANPVLLYVETPYNILEIIDWIAQAQLITAVGPKKTAELRRINVRAIFDLARIGDSPHFRRCALQILIEPENFRVGLDTASEQEVLDMFNCMFTSIGGRSARHPPGPGVERVLSRLSARQDPRHRHPRPAQPAGHRRPLDGRERQGRGCDAGRCGHDAVGGHAAGFGHTGCLGGGEGGGVSFAAAKRAAKLVISMA